MDRISPETLQQTVTGLNLRAGTLADQIAAPATLVAFLRHLGCMFCREMVADLKTVAASDAAFPPVLLITQSPLDDATAFFAERWPEARAVCDPELQLYKAFDIARATFGGLLGPAVWTCSLRVLPKGYTQKLSHTLRPPFGDPWLLSAMFLMSSGGDVHWQHRATYAGERPDYAAIPLRPARRAIGAW